MKKHTSPFLQKSIADVKNAVSQKIVPGPELYSRSDLILSSQIRSGLCVSFKKSSDQSSCLNLNLSFDLKLTSDHWCAFSTVSLCELKIKAQVQVQA